MRERFWRAWDYLRRELSGWSASHFVFDACLTGVLSLVLGWVTDMPWKLQIVLILLMLGTVSSGIVLVRRAVAAFHAPARGDDRHDMAMAITNLKSEILNAEDRDQPRFGCIGLSPMPTPPRKPVLPNVVMAVAPLEVWYDDPFISREFEFEPSWLAVAAVVMAAAGAVLVTILRKRRR